jgi:hypothetical protein
MCIADRQAIIANGHLMDNDPYDETDTTAEQFDAMWKEAGKYDFDTPADLETRVQNLINWWRMQSDDAGDEGSINIMADQLERVLRGPNADLERNSMDFQLKPTIRFSIEPISDRLPVSPLPGEVSEQIDRVEKKLQSQVDEVWDEDRT